MDSAQTLNRMTGRHHSNPIAPGEYSVREYSQALGVTRAAVHKQIRLGKIIGNVKKIGHYYVITIK